MSTFFYNLHTFNCVSKPIKLNLFPVIIISIYVFLCYNFYTQGMFFYQQIKPDVHGFYKYFRFYKVSDYSRSDSNFLII